MHIRADAEDDATLFLEATGTLKHSRLLFTNEHFIQARNGQNLTFTTQRETHFVFQNGSLRSVNGSATAPTYSFSDNTNTGMFRPQANTIGFSTGNTERVRIDPNGNVGIGTTALNNRLEVNGYANATSGYKVGNMVVINSSRDYSGKDGTFSGALTVTGTSTLDGNVGIGTTPTSNSLTVNGAVEATSFSGSGAGLTNVPGDNLGNHTATQNIKLSGKWLSGDGGDEGVYINNNGYVGIGAIPNEKLDVAGIVRSTQGYNVGNNSAIDINRNFNGNNGTFSGILSVTGNSHFTGNVGIGTTSPDAKFHVKANESSTFTAKIQTGTKSVYFGRAIYGSGLEWGNSYIGLGLFRDGDNSWKTEVDAAANGGAMIWGTIGGSLAFTCIPTSTQPGQQVLNDAEIKANTRMYLTSTGVLKVNEVLVKADIWSDYVFHDEYKLPDLYEVEKFISENRHLPDIPSERVVMEEGINLGEMDALLLKKIEELTLYVIELKKENEVMRHQIEQLAK